MPMSKEFKSVLAPRIPMIRDMFNGRSCHVFHERGIRDTLDYLRKLTDKNLPLGGFTEMFAVKAAPIPYLLRIMKEYGFGADCSSPNELELARQAGITPDKIMYTSNNTQNVHFRDAMLKGGSIINFDDVGLLDKPIFAQRGFPKTVAFRINPGDLLDTSSAQLKMSGKAAKYGAMHEQLFDAYQMAIDRGAKKFGIHTMICSNSLEYKAMVDCVTLLFRWALDLEDKLGIEISFINMGGGIGIPYRPKDKKFDMAALFSEIGGMQRKFKAITDREMHIMMESGRWVAGPHGVLLTQAINRKDIYQVHIGVRDSMVGNPRPGIYGAYHNISVFDGVTFTEKTIKEHGSEKVNVVGGICEGCDTLTIPGQPRVLPKIRHSEENGDMIVSEDCGAHSVSMPGNYNNWPRLGACIIALSGEVKMIFRPEEPEDLLYRTNHL